MKKLPCIVALLLGVAFIFYGLNFFFKFIPTPSPQTGTPAANFIGAMYGSGYLALIKALEVIGGALLILPRTRAWGLVLVGAILFNIVCFHVFFFGGLYDAKVIVMVLAGLYLAWVGRKGFCCLACCGSGECLGTCGCCNKDGQSGGCCSTEKPASTGCCGGK